MDNSECIMQILYDSRLVKDLMSGWQKARKRIPEKLSRFEMYLAGSAIAKTVWNHQLGYNDMYDISDIDLIYFDPFHTTYQQEDIVASDTKSTMPDYISFRCDIKNQARVHIWHEEHFGKPLKPYRDIVETLMVTTTKIQQMAISIDRKHVICGDRSDTVCSDIMNMVIRPNDNATLPESYAAKSGKWKSAYPQLIIR